MDRNYSIEKRSKGYIAVDSKGNEIGLLRADEGGAALDGHHWSHRPTAFKRYGFKKLHNSNVYRARPFWGIEARIVKVAGSWALSVLVDGELAHTAGYPTREKAAASVGPYGREMVETRNILNRDAGPIMIARSEKGGCCDPGTERYHSM